MALVHAGLAQKDQAFAWLDAPILRVTAVDAPVPYSPPLEDYYLPQVSDIVAAVAAQRADGLHRELEDAGGEVWKLDRRTAVVLHEAGQLLDVPLVVRLEFLERLLVRLVAEPRDRDRVSLDRIVVQLQKVVQPRDERRIGWGGLVGHGAPP